VSESIDDDDSCLAQSFDAFSTDFDPYPQDIDFAGLMKLQDSIGAALLVRNA
jgi:hypothetical protein